MLPALQGEASMKQKERIYSHTLLGSLSRDPSLAPPLLHCYSNEDYGSFPVLTKDPSGMDRKVATLQRHLCYAWVIEARSL